MTNNTNDKDKELEEFKKELEIQKQKVYKKIDPILQLYHEGGINKKELVEKLAEAFYSLE